jgi:hypothetical protein
VRCDLRSGSNATELLRFSGQTIRIHSWFSPWVGIVRAGMKDLGKGLELSRASGSQNSSMISVLEMKFAAKDREKRKVKVMDSNS